MRRTRIAGPLLLLLLVGVIGLPGLANGLLGPGPLIFADDFETGDLSLWSNGQGEDCGFPHCWLDPLTPCPPSPGCSFGDQTCFMGELLGEPPVDLCLATPDLDPFPLAEFADCTAAGLLRLSPCGPSSICVQVAPGDVQCRDLCATSEGAIGTTDHPDCRRPEAVCSDAFHPDFGLCE